MAHKSKTQRAKASANRAARKAAREEVAKQAEQVVAAEQAEKPSRSLFKKTGVDDSSTESDSVDKKLEKKDEAKPKKKRFQFLRDVRAEMKRVTWPTKQDVLRWSGVVVVALLFFGIYVAVFDNAIITPILVAISGIGPALGIS